MNRSIFKYNINMKSAKIRVLCLLSLALLTGSSAFAATYTVAKSGKWNQTDTWVGAAPSNIINLNENITINVPSEMTLTIDEDVTITQTGLYIITLSGAGTIEITGTSKFSLINNAATAQTEKNKNRVNLQCDIDIAENATLELDVLNVAFDSGHDINGPGTIWFSRAGAYDNNRCRIQVSNLKKAITGCKFLYASPQKFTYESTSDYVLPGEYYDMGSRNPSMFVYDTVKVTHNSYIENGGNAYISKSNKAYISFNTFTNNKALTFNVDVTLNSIANVYSLTIADTNTLTIAADITWKDAFASPKKLIIDDGVTFTITNATLDSAVIGSGAKLNIADNGSLTFPGTSNISGAGTLNFNGTATIKNLTDCLAVSNITFSGSNKTITYDYACTYIIPGTYANLTLNANTDGETRMLCDPVIVNNAFNPGRDFTLQGNGGRKAFVVKGSVNSGKKLTFNNVNVALGNIESAGTMNVSVTAFNIGENDTLTVAGNVNFKSNSPSFNGVDGKNGEIIINAGKSLTTEQTINFANDQTISGNGTFTISKQITGTKLTTLANVNLTGGAGSTIEYEVAGGTFTNTNATNNYYVAKLTVNGGTYVSATDKTIRNLTVEAGTFVAGQNSKVDAMTVTGGTVQVEKNKTLTVTTGNKLNVDGAATFVGKAGSKFITDNVELFENAALTIKDTVTLTRPLVVNNNATLVGGTVSDTLKWDSPEHCKISVTAGTLTISDTLTVAGNVTLEGAMKVAEGGNLNLAGSTIAFGPTTKFTGTQDTISFVAGVVISGLKNDPDVRAKYLKFPGAVTYDATCAAMFPGVYGNGLTLSTEAGKNIAIYDSVTITGALNWAAGRIVLNGNPLIVKETFSSGTFNENHMVVAGKKGKYIFVADAAYAALDLTAPVGTSSLTSAGTLLYSYSPATINIGEAVAIGDSIIVEV